MKISVVTPSFNQGNFIKEAIDSVMTQNSCEFEHIIQDNCSTDNTQKILKSYPHLRVTIEKDKGQSDALNKGFKAASGDIIGWLNADDRYLPGAFKAVSDFFAANPSCDIIYGHYRLIDEAGRVLSYRKELGFDLFMLKYLHILYIPSTTTFFRRRVFEENNFLDINYHYAMDYDFFLRLGLKGYKFCHIPVFLADFRTHTGSKSQKQALKQKEEMEQALFKNDPYLSQCDAFWRIPIRRGLMAVARLKRYVLKFFIGAYCCSEK